ncbi:MAG TPA: hypothetical protein VJB02_05260 [Coxiellaceae bacterium]|nr:hypothetical protein [Coxiellaceae bacterium]
MTGRRSRLGKERYNRAGNRAKIEEMQHEVAKEKNLEHEREEKRDEKWKKGH